METYLVTGGCGFIGSHIVDRLISDGHKVVVIDNLSTGKIENLNTSAIFLEGSITDKYFVDRTFEKYDFNGVINQASHINTSIPEENAQFDLAINVQGTINLMDATIQNNSGKFIYASSVAVYGSPKKIPLDENGPIKPIFSYGIAKKCAEDYIHYYGSTRKLNFNIARYGNIYGPRQPIYGEVGVIAIFTQKIINHEPLVVFGNGEHIRDFLYIDDAVEATMQLLKYSGSDTFNVAMGQGCSVNDVVAAFQRATGHPLKISFKDERENELGKFCANISKIQKTTGWTPQFDLSSGINSTFTYYRNLI